MMNDIVSISESILERMASEEQAQIEAFPWAAFYAANVSFGKEDFSKWGQIFQWEHQPSESLSDFYVGPKSVLRLDRILQILYNAQKP